MVCRLEGCGSHNLEHRWWLGMSTSWTVGLTRRWGARQTRTHNLQPMAPVLPFLSREQSCSLSLLVIELTCLSLGNSACVYKYRSLFLEMPCQYCFPLFSLEPYPRSPCALLSATIQFSIMLCSMWLLSLRAICHISGCSLVLTKASLCMH